MARFDPDWKQQPGSGAWMNSEQGGWGQGSVAGREGLPLGGQSI